MSTEAAIADLAHQLGLAWRRPLDAVFGRRTRADDLVAYAALAAQVERLRPLAWDLSPTEALMTVVRESAIALSTTECPQIFSGSWSELALILTGFADPPTENLDATRRMALVRERFSQKATEPQERSLRADVWERLARVIDAASPRQSRPRPSPERPSGEVQRRELYREARWALRGPARAVVLWGESGNGKSFLARQIVRDEYAGQRVAVLREDVGTNSAYDRDLIRELEKYGVPSERCTDAASRDVELARLLADHESFDLVVFDNVSHDRIRHLLRSSAVKVLITTRSLLQIEGGENLRIPSYSEPEALLAARLMLPDESDADLNEFCRQVGNRPIVIDLFGRQVRQSQVDLTDLARSVRANVKTAVGSAYAYLGGYEMPFGEHASATVVEVYRRAVESIQDAENVLAVLDALLWKPRSSGPDHISFLAEDPHLAIDHVAARIGIDVLSRLGFVDVADDSVTMNDFTRELLQVLRASAANSAIRAFLNQCESPDLPAHLANLIDSDDITEPQRLVRILTSNDVDLSQRDGFWAWQAANMKDATNAFGMLAPGRRAGVYQVAPETFIAWQRDYELFEPSRSEPRYAFIQLYPTGPAVVTSEEGRRQVLSAHQAAVVAAYGLVYNIACRVRDLDPDEPRWGYGVQLQLFADDGRNHTLTSIIPREVAAAHGLPLWSRCGLFFVPSEGVRVDYSTECQECAAFQHDSMLTTDYRHDIVSMWEIIDPSRSGWRLYSAIWSAITYLHLQNGWLPAPDDASMKLVHFQEYSESWTFFTRWSYAFAAHYIAVAWVRDRAWESDIRDRIRHCRGLRDTRPQLSPVDEFMLSITMVEAALEIGDTELARTLVKEAAQVVSAVDALRGEMYAGHLVSLLRQIERREGSL